MSREDLHEIDLMAMIRNPDQKSYGFYLLVMQYQKRLLRYVMRMVGNKEDAEDIIQEVFIRIFEKIDQVQQDAKLHFWIMKVTNNTTLMFLRRQKLRRVFQLDYSASRMQTTPASSDSRQFSPEQIQHKFHNALLQLAPQQRAIFNLKYFEEMQYEQIAEVMKLATGTCKAAYHKSVRKIEKIIMNT